MSGRPDVARLFVAIPVPEPASRGLALLQPDRRPGVRPTRRSGMHVTLHFIGRSEVAPVCDALRSVRAPAFSLRCEDVCLISTGRGRRIFWAGIAPEPALSVLHAKTAEALRAVGFEAEARAYTPHVTLARLTAEAPPGIADSLKAMVLPPIEFECSRFSLYSSQTEPEGARYDVIDSWPLEPIRPADEDRPA